MNEADKRKKLEQAQVKMVEEIKEHLEEDEITPTKLSNGTFICPQINLILFAESEEGRNIIKQAQNEAAKIFKK